MTTFYTTRGSVLAILTLTLLPIVGCASSRKEVVVREFPPVPSYPVDHQYNLDELIDLSIHKNPALDAARYTAAASEGLVDAVKSLYLPTLRYDFLAAGYNNDIAYHIRALGLVKVDIPLTSAYNINNTAAVGQILATFGKRTSVLKQAKDLAAIQKLEILTVQDCVAFQVAECYFLVALTNDIDNVLDDTVRRMRVFHRVARGLNELGSLRASSMDTMEATLLLTQIDQLRVLTQAGRQQAYEGLRVAIGVPHDQPLALASASLPPPVSTVEILGNAATLAEGFCRRPELRQLDLLADLFHQQVQFAKALYAPSIGFVGAYTVTGGNSNSILSAIQGLIGTVVLDWPIYSPGRAALLREVLAMEQASLALQREIEQVLALEMETTRVSAQKSLAMVLHATQARQIAAEHYNAALQAYSRELVPANQVIIALTLNMAAKLEYLAALHGYHSSRACLKRVLGDRDVKYDF
jgi:outer membrane protein TolC